MLLALNSSEFPGTDVSPPDPDEVTVDILSITPFQVAVYDGTSYEMVVRVHYGSQVHFRCTSCSTHSRSCDHVSTFQEWTEETEAGSQLLIQDHDDSPEVYSSISKKKIPYPLPDGLKVLHDQYESGLPFPEHLIPPYDPARRCVHGNPFEDADPVTSQWIACEQPTIYKASTSITTEGRKVYFRPAHGQCSCK